MATRSGQVRVPSTLQTVLTVANRGKNINVPPPNRVAAKTFKRDIIAKDDTTSTRGGIFRRSSSRGRSSSRSRSGERNPPQEQIKVSNMVSDEVE